MKGSHFTHFDWSLSATFLIAIPNDCPNLSISPLCSGLYAAVVLCLSIPNCSFKLTKASEVNTASLSDRIRNGL